MLRFNCTPSISQRPLLLPSVSPIRVSPPSQSFFPLTRSFRISESHYRSSIKRLKVSCFRHEEFSSETSKPETVDDVLHEDLQEPEINKPSRSKGSWVSILQESVLLGKMVFLGLIVPSHKIGIGPTSSRSRIRLVASFTSHHLERLRMIHAGSNCICAAFKMSLCYTLPEIIGHDSVKGDGVNTVVLKFQSIGKFFNVYGSLSTGSGTHWVRVNEDRLVPFLNVIWANCGSVTETIGNDEAFSTSPAREVFAFWRTVKDRLALPLLTDLCEKAGLDLPPCFM